MLTRATVVAVALLAFAAGSPRSGGASPAETLERPAPVAPAPVASPGVEAALERRESVPVIVTLRDGGLPSARSLASRRARIADLRRRALTPVDGDELQVTAAWAAAPAFAATVTEEGLEQLLQAPEVLRVDVDAPVRATLRQSSALIRADAVQRAGLTGKGVTVAVLDTGIDTDHPDLADDLVGERCFVRLENRGGCPDGSSSQSGPGSAEDDQGHGTLVSSIITSRGVASPLGVAPAAKIVAVKVLSADGSGATSGIVTALDWVLTNRPDVKVVNMSLGSDELFASACDTAARAIPYASIINALRSRGVTVFAASGNDGSSRSMGAPACVTSAVSVGAVYDADGDDECDDGEPQVVDSVTCYSNGAEGLDLLAPGSWITSGSPGGGSETWNGTSAATPHAAAVAALMLEARPTLSPDQLEATLKATGVRVTDDRSRRVFPRVDALAAVNALPSLPPPTAPPPYLPAATTTFPDPTGDTAGPDISSVTLTSSPDGLLIFSVSVPNRPVLGGNDTIWTLIDADRNPSTGSGGADVALVSGAGGATDLARWSGSWRGVRALADASHGGGVLTFKISQDELGMRSDFAFAVQALAGGAISDRSPSTGSWPFPSLPLTVTRSGTGGGTVSSTDAAGIACGLVCTAAFARGTVVTLTAVPGAGSTFVDWGGACAGVETCTVAVTDLVSVNARFELLRRLVVAKEGTGTGMVTGGSAIACGETCAASVANGTSLTFTAQPASGSRFDGWTGACAGPEPCALAVDADKALSARFTDVAAPEVQPFSSGGRRGRLTTLRFGVRDNGAAVRVRLTVHAGRRTVAILPRGPLAANGEVESVEWRIPSRFRGKGRFCVRGTDLAGNTGALRCARLAVRR